MKTAIGKVIAPIVNLFIPAITAAVNVVTTFFTALARVLAIFGLEFPDVVQKASTVAGGAARSIGAIGDSADETAGNLARTGSAAQKAAKKMNKAFSSVDELNVMKFNKTDSAGGSGGSGSGAGGSGGDTLGGVSGGGAVDTGNSAVGSAIENTSKKIQSALEPLTKINFDNLVKAFGKLKDAVKAVGGTLWDGLKWAYYNILVPLAKWTIEDLLPAFFNLLAGALEVLNPLLVALGQIFQPIWDNVLQPIASWTGGVIVDVLNGVGDALSVIGTWMSENQETVTTITGLIVGFFAAWEITKLFAFIQMSGGIVTAIGLMTGAILTNIAAKLVDKAETIYLTILYAKDFVVACGQAVVALLAQAAAFVVANAGVILVVAGIVALIAIIVLLVKHWDQVKEAALKCWEKIKETWQKVKDWFMQNVVEPVKNYFVNLWETTLLKARYTWDRIKETWQKVKDWFNNNLIIPVTNFFKTMWEKISNLASNTWTAIKNVWQSVKDWFNSKIIQPVSNFFSGMWNNLKNGASNAWAGIKNIFSTVGSFFQNTFSNAWNAVKNIFSSGGKIFDGIKDGISNAFTSIVNRLISGINRVVQKPFNAINSALSRLRNISILDISPFKWLPTISIPEIPFLAQGAYFQKNNPTLAVVGDNTTQGEYVTPENKLKQSVKEAMQEMGGMFGNNNMQFDFTIRMVGEDGRTIIKKINDVTISDGKVSLII
jgi:phage-related protein